ncbi:adenine deaminase [uncultured Phascolarctobacterium sp.]|uniref:adenine deaminase n=1 Tax=uncultured Phascolarctobacterium sp. TaxID=512296 RepID=UPI0025E7BEDF|nr:adenine deaminase [uncultured Phascolarctobacterium sp.]
MTMQRVKIERTALLAAARGDEPADLVLKGGFVFNGFTGEWEVGDVAIIGDTIAGIGSYKGKKELDVTGKYVTPGLMDAHLHIESTMVAPRELAKILLLNGVTTIFADPHEIANVLGTEGIELMLAETETMPLDVFFMLPSCVPATVMETSGAMLAADALAPLLAHERVLGLGEMMNYPGAIHGAPEVLDKLFLVDGGLCDGHAPGVSGQALSAYLAAGISSDHEATTAEEAEEKLRRGAYLLLREASGAHNLLDLLPAVTPLNSRRCCLSTDDRHLDELVSEGSINYLVEIGVAHGYAVEQLLQMATLNTAERFRLYDRGALAPGYRADINVFNNLVNFQPQLVIKDGTVVVSKQKLLWQSPPLIAAPVNTMRLEDVRAQQLQLPAQAGRRARVIRIVPEQILTELRFREPLIQNGLVVSDTERDIVKLAVWERHGVNGNVGVGLVQGFGLKRGALASTVAHDSHNLIVAGVNDEDMLTAAVALQQVGGGLAVVVDGEVKALLPLPLAGLMSDQNTEFVQHKLQQLNFWASELGVPENVNAFNCLSFLALPVIPSLRLSDKGLVDVDKFVLVDLWE